MISTLVLPAFAWLACVDASATASVTASWLAQVVAGAGDLPSLAEVQRLAEATLALPDEAAVGAWAGRARLRGLLPALEVSLGTDHDLDVRDSLTERTSRVTSAGEAFGFRASARWQLGEVIFSDAELRASREALARSAAVALARERATRLYFERVELLMEACAGEEPRWLRAALLDGQLSALTGGHLRWPSASPAPRSRE